MKKSEYKEKIMITLCFGLILGLLLGFFIGIGLTEFRYLPFRNLCDEYDFYKSSYGGSCYEIFNGGGNIIHATNHYFIWDLLRVLFPVGMLLLLFIIYYKVWLGNRDEKEKETKDNR